MLIMFDHCISWLLAGWLAGRPQGPQELRHHGQWRVKCSSRGADNNQFARIQDWNKEAYKIQGCKTAGLQGLQGYKATTTAGYLMERYAPQPGGPKGPADLR